MTRAEATIVTTAVPMRGYEEALLVANVCSAQLHDLPHALQARLRLEARNAPDFGGLASWQGYGQHSFDMSELQIPAIPCFTLPSEWGSALKREELRLECRDHGYLDAVLSAYVSFLLAAITACTKGELTKPIVLRGQAGVGGKIDLRSGMWFIQCKGELQDLTDELDVLIHCRPVLDVRAFLEDVYDLGQRDLQAATDKVFNTIDRLLCDGREELCDEILASVEVPRLPSALLRSFLTITAPAKDKLGSRPSFFAKAYGEVERQRGPHMAKRLLGRLA